jgi:hypothetical protein
MAAAERQIKELEAQDVGAGLLRKPRRLQPVIDQPPALMWEVGDLMNQWEALSRIQKCNLSPFCWAWLRRIACNP